MRQHCCTPPARPLQGVKTCPAIGHSERVKVPGVEGNLTRSRDPQAAAPVPDGCASSPPSEPHAGHPCQVHRDHPGQPTAARSEPALPWTPVGPADHFGRAPCCALPDDRPPIVARQTPTSAPTRRRVSLTQNGWLGFSFSKILLPQWGAPGITDVVVLQSIPPQRIASRISPPAALATGDRYTRHKPVVLQDFWCTYLWTPTMSR